MECSEILLKEFSKIEVIYVFGRYKGDIRKQLSSVEKYDSSTKVWSETTPLPQLRVFMSCVVVNDKIYLCNRRSSFIFR